MIPLSGYIVFMYGRIFSVNVAVVEHLSKQWEDGIYLFNSICLKLEEHDFTVIPLNKWVYI